MSPQASLSKDTLAPICSCGRSMINGRGGCPACLERQQIRRQRSSDLPTSSSLPPPPSQISHELPIRGRSIRPKPAIRRSSSSIAADTAKAFDIDSDEYEDFFPHYLYRAPRRRTTPRGSSSSAPSPSPSIARVKGSPGPKFFAASEAPSPATTPPQGTSSSTLSQDSLRPSAASAGRSITPDSGNGASVPGTYSPMAAPFASLKRRTPHVAASPGRSSTSGMKERDGLQMDLRMFDGPA